MRVNQPTTDRRLSYRDYLLFPADGNRHELLEGAHYVTPCPNVRHQRVVGRLHAHLWQHLANQGGGEVLLAPVAVVFTLFDVVEPDILFVSSARKHIVTEQHVQGPPDLVVEVLSPSSRRRDQGRKRALYNRGNVLEYWLVDPVAEVVRIYRRENGQLRLAAEVTNDPAQTLQSPLLPGLALALDRLFTDEPALRR